MAALDARTRALVVLTRPRFRFFRLSEVRSSMDRSDRHVLGEYRDWAFQRANRDERGQIPPTARGAGAVGPCRPTPL